MRCIHCGAEISDRCPKCNPTVSRDIGIPGHYDVLTMKVWYNCFIPFGRFVAMAFCGLIAARKKYEPLSWVTRHHEEIHKTQALQDFKKEGEKTNWRAWVRFYWHYLGQWLRYGYRNAPFEREAKVYAAYPEYIQNREPRAWEKFDTKKKKR